MKIIEKNLLDLMERYEYTHTRIKTIEELQEIVK